MMNKKLEFDDFSNSQFAIKEYIDFKEDNFGLHDARVVISTKGKKLYNDIIKVVTLIDTNNSVVELIGNAQFTRDYFIRYTNEFQRFKFINGTLLIQAEDRWGNVIEINITGI